MYVKKLFLRKVEQLFLKKDFVVCVKVVMNFLKGYQKSTNKPLSVGVAEAKEIGLRDGGMEGWRDGGMKGWRDGMKVREKVDG